MYPTSDHTIDTPYGATGPSWSSIHDGIDFSVGFGTAVYSMWGGTVTEAAYPTHYGSAFGRAVVIDHDKLPDGSPGGWGIYCHLSSEVVSVGQRMEAGTLIGYSGDTGNVTGPHLHVGVYMQNGWCSGCGVNPQRWLDAGGGSAQAPSGATVYLSKLHYGQEDSDSVGLLQEALNAHSLAAPGNITLPITKGYWDQTGTVVVACQNQHGYGNDPVNQSFVGASQANHLFAGRGVTIINDL
jgi:Peptidase family M23